MEYFLGLLNSRYINWLYTELVQETGRVFAQVKLSKIQQLPVRTLDFSEPADRSRHDKLVRLVKQMLAAKKAWAQSKTDVDRNYYGNKCAALDRQIDQLVYELYGLTEEEITVVKQSAN